ELWPPKELFFDFINNEEKKFWEDMKSINVKNPYAKIRVTEVHNEMIQFIQELMNKNLAYISQNKSVYFDTQKFKELYSNIGFHKETGNELNLKNKFSKEKKNANDFALWKTAKKYEVFFDS